jgi:DNA ligase (NAD+)
LAAATEESLTAVDEIGERIAQSVCDYFRNPYHIELIERLQTYGLQFERQVQEDNRPKPLKDLRIVVSGVFTNFSREEIKTTIEQNGGIIVSGVSAKTDLIVAGEGMGPSKRQKAEALGVTIIDESTLLSRINATE